MSSGLRVLSQLEATGQGLAGAAYVRGLVKAGVAVQWVPLVQRGGGLAPLEPGAPAPLATLMADDSELGDLAALLQATARPLVAATVLVHSAPEHWHLGFRGDCRNIGMTAWEADRPPPHWLPLLNQAHAICVPGESSRAALAAAGVRPPLQVVPHIRRGQWRRIERAELDDFAARLGIAKGNTVFYSIGAWDPRKDPPALLRAFAEAFSADDAATLVLKTGAAGYGQAPFHHYADTAQLAERTLEELATALGRPLPSICLLPYELSGRGMELLHALGDCYVSLSHGEAWGLGAFDAASRGTPVIITGWGGQMDYLGAGWRGALPYRMVETPVFPPMQPLYWPPQRWAEADGGAAVEALRSFLRQPQPWRQEAAHIAAAMQPRYDEAGVTRRLIEVLSAA